MFQNLFFFFRYILIYSNQLKFQYFHASGISLALCPNLLFITNCIYLTIRSNQIILKSLCHWVHFVAAHYSLHIIQVNLKYEMNSMTKRYSYLNLLHKLDNSFFFILRVHCPILDTNITLKTINKHIFQMLYILGNKWHS